MPGSSIGQAFRVTTWGESHGPAIGVVVDGCPPRIPLSEGNVQAELDRRRPGQSGLTTQRREADRVAIQSGVIAGRTTGHPIAMVVRNKDARPADYEALKTVYRPSHADYTFEAKYGIRDPSGGGRSSARVTVGHVAAGAVARRFLEERFGVECTAYVKRTKDIEADVDPETVTRAEVEKTPVRCPDPEAAARMVELIERTRDARDSLGGVVECSVRGVPPGLGEPVFDKLESDLAKAMLAINASKGFEIGSGFAGTRLFGSEHNDRFVMKDGPAGDRDEPRRRGPRRHLDRDADRVPGGVQADLDHREGPTDRGLRGKGSHPGSQGAPRPLRPSPRRPHRGSHGLPGARRPRPPTGRDYVSGIVGAPASGRHRAGARNSR